MTETLTPTASQAPEASPAPAPKPYLVCVLYYGAVDLQHSKCMEGLRNKPEVADIMEVTGCPYIDIGRSIAATVVLDQPENFGGVLFIDHDMIFEPEQALATIRAAQLADATVGAAYSMRRSGRIIGALDDKYMQLGEHVVFFEGGGLRRANFLGMGLTAIARSVLVRLVEFSKRQHADRLELLRSLTVAVEGGHTEQALGLIDLVRAQLKPEDLQRLSSGLSDAPVIPFFSLIQRDGIYYGEDVSFCARSHLAEVPVYMDTRIRVGHKGSYVFHLEDVTMEVPSYSSLTCVNVAETKFTDAPPNAAALSVATAPAESPAASTPAPAEARPAARPVKLVSATRGSMQDFWTKSLLGRSLKAIPSVLMPDLQIYAENTLGLPELYNRVLRESTPDTLVLFVHDDVYIHDATLLWRLREAHLQAEIVGLAGSRKSDLSQPSWLLHFDADLMPQGWQGECAASGAVSHCPPPDGKTSCEHVVPEVQMTIFGESPARVELLDGLFLSVDVGAVQSAGVQFDERFDFHHYDIDFTREASRKGLIVATWPIVVTHASGGNFASPAWRASARKYLDKWAAASAAAAE